MSSAAATTVVDLSHHQQHQHQHQQQRVKVVSGYALQQKLGSGSFAVVYKGVKFTGTGRSSDNHNDEFVAIKAIDRDSDKLTKKVLQNLEVEISILRTYRHRNIVCMHDVQKTAHHFYLLLEYCAGGDVQGLIRSRQSRRLSEGLTRRLMRDLASGLKFLWGQELIHRDIKPQNLLLTGPLPLDEVNDPAKTAAEEEQRRLANFSSSDFCLKIADFGFARHLQTTSLAETLCGSPLYMAPEILQHHRYDAKADLWSVGTVLFEMISGEPPFHGENHIDLLRNIQRKAVRLPKDVRVSKECVNLLRLLLSRNPLSRAGFKEFFTACDQFVALGCQGVATVDQGTCKRPSMDLLGTIPENNAGSDSLMTVATTNAPPPSTQQQPQALGMMMTPPGVVLPPPTATVPTSPTAITTAMRKPSITRTYIPNPLVPSPPASSGAPSAGTTELPTISTRNMPPAIEIPTRPSNDISLQNSSTDENSFVMVEYGSAFPKSPTESSAAVTAVVSHYSSSEQHQYSTQHHRLQQSPPSSPGFFLNKSPSIPMVVKNPKGMLSTSPGTGGALMGMLTGRPQLSYYEGGKQLEARIKGATKMLCASEDVGRRAISVAHLGDKRAYLAIRLSLANEGSSSSVLSVTPMEGIEEEENEEADVRESGTVTDDSSSTEIMASVRRRRSSSVSMADANKTAAEDELDEMPFAVQTDTAAPIVTAGLPTRSSVSFNKEEMVVGPRPGAKTTPAMIRSHFNEALSCYLKALRMLKGAVSAAEGVSKELNGLTTQRLTADQQKYLGQMKKRCEVTTNWLGNQFRGVLERADAANAEIGKLPLSTSTADVATLTSIEELLYNNALGFGREAAVKQLLGQYEAARSCYRSAGLLAETLLMEQKVEGDDRKVLEGYVDGFAAQITALDEILLQQSQQSRLAASTATVHSHSLVSSRRGPSVPGFASPPFAMDSFNK